MGGVQLMQEGFMDAVHHSVAGNSQLDGGLRRWVDNFNKECVGIPAEWTDFVSGVLRAFSNGLAEAADSRKRSDPMTPLQLVGHEGAELRRLPNESCFDLFHRAH